MFTWFSKKDRKIANLEVMVKNRDKLINDLQTKITNLENNIELLVSNLSVAKKKQLGYADETTKNSKNKNI